MSLLIESVAHMTQSRDRDALEATVVEVLASLVRPLEIRLYKLVPVADGVAVHCRVVVDENGRSRLCPLPSRGGDLQMVDQFPWVRKWIGGAVLPMEIARPGVACYLAPVIGPDGPYGWIELDHQSFLSEDHRSIIQGMLRIYSNHLAILDYGERDSLTGLMNRKTFDDSFLKVLADYHRQMAAESAQLPPAIDGLSASLIEAAQLGSPPDRALVAAASAIDAAPYWLGVCDIDFFKRINDQFGHLYGDEVLVLLARFMRDSFRLADRMFRFGGEEFAVLLDRTGNQHVHEVFERFRVTVEKHHFPQIGQVTVSIGYTRILPGDTPAQAFDRADAALYHAKRTGRNRCVAWDDLERSGHVRTQIQDGGVELFA